MEVIDINNREAIERADGLIMTDLFSHPDLAIEMGMAVFPPGTHVNQAAHDQHEYSIFLEGSLKVRVEDGEYIVSAGQVSSIAKGETHESINDSDTECRLIWILLKDDK